MKSRLFAVIDAAVGERGVGPGDRTLGTDNGTAFTSRAFCARLCRLGIVHRRGGYRGPESQVFIESWFSRFKQRCVWREEFETLDEARAAIGAVPALAAIAGDPGRLRPDANPRSA